MAEAYPAHAMAEPATDIAGAQRVDHREFAAEMRRLRRAPPSVVEVRDRAVEVGECRVAEIYEEDYDLGCKGGTVFRPNPVTGAVLRAPDREISVETPRMPERALRAPLGLRADFGASGRLDPASAHANDAIAKGPKSPQEAPPILIVRNGA